MSHRFDDLARRMAVAGGLGGTSRRSLVARAAAGGTALLGLGRGRAAAQESAVGAEDFEAQGERPGKYSRREGIESWRLNRRPGGYEVEFRHDNRSLSGTIVLTFGGGSMSYVLTRDRERIQLAFSNGGTVSANDAAGRSATASWDRQRGRWELSAASDRVLRDSRRDFRLGLAIASDLDPDAPTRQSDASALAGSDVDECRDRYVQGTGFPRPPIYARSVACDIATKDLEEECTNVSGCSGCCRVLPDCDCFCLAPLGSDFLCGCDRYGTAHDRICA